MCRKVDLKLNIFAAATASILAIDLGLSAPAENAFASSGPVTMVAGAGALLHPGAAMSELPGGFTSTKGAGNSAEASPDDSEVSQKMTDDEGEAANEAESEPEPDSEPESVSDLVMADVNEMMNVRALPDISSEKIGVLYKDCGGTILERQNGWTKLQSGELVGWASDDYLLFGDEAEALAEDVGVKLAEITTDSLRVRKAPGTDSGIYGLVKTGDEFEVIKDDDGSGFLCIDYKGKDGYISSDYATTRLRIDVGETWEAIIKREEEERERKARLTANQGAVAANTDELKLLAALIMCEAGNQPYEGQLGVGAVVMNRVRSGAYPNTIYGVIYASGQFSPAANGSVASRYVGEAPINQSCYTAAQAAINGETSVGSALHFKRAGSHEGVVIGSHVFY